MRPLSQQTTTMPHKSFAFLHKEIILRKNSNDIRIYAPQIIEPDCIRCHHDWQLNEQGGILAMVYDLGSLNRTIRLLQIFLFLGSAFLLDATILILFFVMRRQLTAPINNVSRKPAQSKEIATASREQSQEISQASLVIGGLAQATQQNVETSDQSARVAAGLADHSSRLENHATTLLRLVGGARRAAAEKDKEKAPER